MASETGPTAASPDPEQWLPDGVPPRLPLELSTAMSEQADRFEPSNDAYRKLAEAVARDAQPTAGRWLRPLVVAASAAAVVGIGASLLSARDSQQIGTGPGVEVAVDDADDDLATDDDDVTADTEPTGDDGGDPGSDEQGQQDAAAEAATAVEVEPDELTGPVRTEELAAAQAFLDLLRIDHGAAEVVDGRVMVRSFPEGGSGDGAIVAELVMVELEGGFAVIEAATDGIVIDEVSQGDLPDGILTVSGAGTGFEGMLEVRVVSAFDNRVLAAGSAPASGAEQPAPFRAELEVAGAERGWIVVSGGGADRVLPPFAAWPVGYRAGADNVDRAVVRVPPDDRDDGLNLRAGPGATSEPVTVIPAGRGGVRRTAVAPVPVGDDAWWQVTTADGDGGWVNSRYLASTEPVADERLASLAMRLGGPDAPLPPNPELPFGRRAEVAVGTIDDPIEVDPESLLLGRGWDEVRSVSARPDGGDPAVVTETLADLLGLGSWDPDSIEVGAGFASPADEQAATRYFGDLPRLAVTVTGSDDPDGVEGLNRRVFLFAEDTPVGPEIVGLIVEFAVGP